jgi:hypothetical protein
VVYTDDILICSATRAEHVSLVCRVLGRLLEHDLYVKAEKHLFFQQSVSFLGYRFSASGVEMENDCISAHYLTAEGGTGATAVVSWGGQGFWSPEGSVYLGSCAGSS